MGKRQIGEMQPFELVITLVIADLATIPMAEPAIPLIHGIIPLLALTCLHYLLSFLSRKSTWFRKIINGKPIILISPDGVDFKALQKVNMNFNDLQESLRTCDYFNLEEILYAILQTNGSLTVIPRAGNSPITANDIGLVKSEASLPIIIISKGKMVKENSIISNITEEFLIKQLKKSNFSSIGEIIFATINHHGKMYVQPYDGKFQIIETPYKGEDKW
jgi:uncharacterized membrane protein YcaP (DUF421 family)